MKYRSSVAFVVWILAVLLLATFAFAAAAPVAHAPGSAEAGDDDDDDKDEAPQVMQNRVVFTDENFNQWIFQNNGSFADARKHLDLLLALRIDDVDRACKLSEAQKKKLQWMGRADIQRFFDLYDLAKKKFDEAKNDQNKINEIWQEIQPLQMMLQAGLFSQDSFLVRAMPHALTEEQSEHWQALDRERRGFRHKADIALAVVSIDMTVPLSAEQRRELTTLLERLTKPSRKGGQFSYWVLEYKLSKLPEEKIRRLFDDVQWKAVQKSFNQFKGMEQWLKQSGALDEDGADEGRADRSGK